MAKIIISNGFEIMKKLRIGFVGLGQRGSGMLRTFLAHPDVDVIAVCDVYDDRVDNASKFVLEKRNHEPRKYSDYNQMLLDKDIDAIYVASSWEEHVNQAIMCMEHHIPVAMEVGGAYSVKDCWRLVNAYEKTNTPIMMMENCCYDKFETLLINLAEQNKFGEIIHLHGAYSHDLREEISSGNIIRHYRLRNYIARNCENYPTHELGPLAKLININAGNRFVSIVSVASKARGLEEYIKEGRCKDKTLDGVKFNQGDIVSTIITCENGETITLTLDTTLPGYYSRQLEVKGTKGCANQEANMVLFDDGEEVAWNPYETIQKHGGNAENLKQYLPKYWRDITKEQIELGHGGMDYFMVATFVDTLLNNKEMPIDVYDAAAWYAITPLSEKSIKNGGRPYKIPDFTRGKYKIRKQLPLYDNEKEF